MDDQPTGIVRLGGFKPTEAQLAAIRAGLERQLARGHHPRLLTPLPRRTRLRLWRDRRVDTITAWLCAHHGCRAAVALWRAFGMWD
jgi:hypothetical protein